MTRALDRALLGVELAFGEVAFVVRAAVLDRAQLAVAVEDRDLQVLPLDRAELAGRKLGDGADVEGLGHGEMSAERESRPEHSELLPPSITAARSTREGLKADPPRSDDARCRPRPRSAASRAPSRRRRPARRP